MSADAVVLRPKETQVLALHLAARKLREADEWLHWGDVPELDEDGHAQLIDSLTDIAARLSDMCSAAEAVHDVDAQEIYQRVT